MAGEPRIGILPSGPRDSLVDVGGVTAGYCALAAGDLQSGVTVILPHPGDLFRDKTPAAAEATGEAIVEVLLSAETVVGFQGHVRRDLTDVAPDWATLPL